jgi:predicted transglutaminase-like cysteine proteinase
MPKNETKPAPPNWAKRIGWGAVALVALVVMCEYNPTFGGFIVVASGVALVSWGAYHLYKRRGNAPERSIRLTLVTAFKEPGVRRLSSRAGTWDDLEPTLRELTALALLEGDADEARPIALESEVTLDFGEYTYEKDDAALVDSTYFTIVLLSPARSASLHGVTGRLQPNGELPVTYLSLTVKTREWTLDNLTGAPVKLADTAGKVTVLPAAPAPSRTELRLAEGTLPVDGRTFRTADVFQMRSGLPPVEPGRIRIVPEDVVRANPGRMDLAFLAKANAKGVHHGLRFMSPADRQEAVEQITGHVARQVDPDADVEVAGKAGAWTVTVTVGVDADDLAATIKETLEVNGVLEPTVLITGK